jgi:hypothetical protein
MLKGHGAKYEHKKEAAIAALLTQKNQEDAARVAGISLKTLKRWMHQPDFREDYRKARWEVHDQVYARAQQNAGVAAAVLLKLMADPVTPASSRIRAALGILDPAREERGLRKEESAGDGPLVLQVKRL